MTCIIEECVIQVKDESSTPPEAEKMPTIKRVLQLRSKYCATGGIGLRFAAQKFLTIPLMVVLTLMAATAASGADYCKWTDEDGTVHYDEKCPDAVTSTIVTAEDERSESQIRAADERSKSLSESIQHTKSTEESRRPESGIHSGVTAHSRPHDSKDISQMSVEELEVICEKEREKRLAPEREQLIQNCITEKRRSQGYCERYHSDYGAAQQIIGTDQVRPALYLDLPECVAAWEARRKEN
jgi:hypothetical protein